jgi:Zn-dependent protease
MLLFESPPPTRYDLNFTLGNIPVRVHPLFWLIALLFGISLGNVLYILLWVPIFFGSILLHELGHAFAMRFFGQSAQIVLHGAGGLTIPESMRWGRSWASVGLTTAQENLISFAGPLAGFMLAGVIVVGTILTGGAVRVALLFGVFPWPVTHLSFGGAVLDWVVGTLLWVNLFWGLVNLTPVYPLDGGQIARRLLIQADPLDGGRKSLWLSVIAGAIMALLGLTLFGSIYMAFLFGLLAFQSYQALRGRGF